MSKEARGSFLPDAESNPFSDPQQEVTASKPPPIDRSKKPIFTPSSQEPTTPKLNSKPSLPSDTENAYYDNENTKSKQTIFQNTSQETLDIQTPQEAWGQELQATEDSDPFGDSEDSGTDSDQFPEAEGSNRQPKTIFNLELSDLPDSPSEETNQQTALEFNKAGKKITDQATQQSENKKSLNKNALKMYQAAMKLEPENPDYIADVAMGLFNLKSYNEANKHFNFALTKCTEDPKYDELRKRIEGYQTDIDKHKKEKRERRKEIIVGALRGAAAAGIAMPKFS